MMYVHVNIQHHSHIVKNMSTKNNSSAMAVSKQNDNISTTFQLFQHILEEVHIHILPDPVCICMFYVLLWWWCDGGCVVCTAYNNIVSMYVRERKIRIPKLTSVDFREMVTCLHTVLTLCQPQVKQMPTQYQRYVNIISRKSTQC